MTVTDPNRRLGRGERAAVVAALAVAVLAAWILGGALWPIL